MADKLKRKFFFAVCVVIFIVAIMYFREISTKKAISGIQRSSHVDEKKVKYTNKHKLLKENVENIIKNDEEMKKLSNLDDLMRKKSKKKKEEENAASNKVDTKLSENVEISEEELNEFYNEADKKFLDIGQSDQEGDKFVSGLKDDDEKKKYKNKLVAAVSTGFHGLKVILNKNLILKGEFKKRFPQVIIGGVKKSGTGALISFLGKHPLIRSSTTEKHFFDKEYDKGLSWYLDQMPNSYENEITMEKTPAYFVRENVPERIFNFNKEIKLIFIFREPVRRAISDFAQGLVRKKFIKNSFKRLMTYKNDSNTIDQTEDKVMVGLYYMHLKRWLKFFPMKQMLLLNGDSFIKDPAPTLVKVQTFLNIDVVINENSFTLNKTKGFYCIRVSRNNHEAPMECLGPTKGRKHPDVDPKVIEKLQDFYRPHNKLFFDFIGEDFGWPT